MAVKLYACACLHLVGILQGANAAATSADPILDRLARLKSNFAHMHHRHRDSPPPQDDSEAPAPQMSFSQAPYQPMAPMQQAPHLDLSVLGPAQPMMGDMQRQRGPLSMGQMNAPQSFEPPQSNFEPPASQDEGESPPPMEEEDHHDDDDGREAQAAKSDPIVQRLAMLKSNFRRMHHSHRSQQSMDTQGAEQNEQPQDFHSDQAPQGSYSAEPSFQRPLNQNSPYGESSYQPNPAPVALADASPPVAPVDAAPSALDMSTATYGSQKPLAARQPVFGLKMPDVEPPPEDEDSPPPSRGGFQRESFQQADDNEQADDDQQDSAGPEPPQRHQDASYDRQSDPIIARLSRFRDNVEQMRNAKTLNGGRGRVQLMQPAPPQETDDEVAQKNGMTAFTDYQAQPDSSPAQPDSPAPQENFQPAPVQVQSSMSGAEVRGRLKPSMSAAEVIAKLQMEGNAQLQAEFHPQSLNGGFAPNVLPGVQPDPESMAAVAPPRNVDMQEDMDRQEGPPVRSRKRMNLWAQPQQQDQGAPMPQQIQQNAGFLDQTRGQEQQMQRQWGPEGQRDAQPAFNQMEDPRSQGQPDPDQDREPPTEQGSGDGDGPSQDDGEEERSTSSRQRDDPIVDRLGMLQNNFKRIRDHAHQSPPRENRESFAQSSESNDAGDSEAQQPQGEEPQPDNQAEDDAPGDQNSMAPQGPPADADQDQDATPPRSINAPHRWSLLQGQSSAAMPTPSSDIAQSSHASLVQFTKAQQAVDPEVAATDKSIDAEVAEAESVGPSSTITDLISKHQHRGPDIDDKLAMIQEGFEKMHMRRR